MSKISPCLWFDGVAEEAAQFYTGIFPDSQIDHITRAPADNPSGPKGSVLTVDFTLAGQRFIGLNGGPDFRFSEAISFSIECEDQAEVDRYWDALVEGGGSPGQCGWLKDRFGVSWQVVPATAPRAAQRVGPGGRGPRDGSDAADDQARRREAARRIRGRSGLTCAWDGLRSSRSPPARGGAPTRRPADRLQRAAHALARPGLRRTMAGPFGLSRWRAGSPARLRPAPSGHRA